MAFDFKKEYKEFYLPKQKPEIVEIPDACKFELFLFDAFLNLESLGLLRVLRQEEFAPVKNATGADSPEIARKMYIAMHKEENI